LAPLALEALQPRLHRAPHLLVLGVVPLQPTRHDVPELVRHDRQVPQPVVGYPSADHVGRPVQELLLPGNGGPREPPVDPPSQLTDEQVGLDARAAVEFVRAGECPQRQRQALRQRATGGGLEARHSAEPVRVDPAASDGAIERIELGPHTSQQNAKPLPCHVVEQWRRRAGAEHAISRNIQPPPLELDPLEQHRLR